MSALDLPVDIDLRTLRRLFPLYEALCLLAATMGERLRPARYLMRSLSAAAESQKTATITIPDGMGPLLIYDMSAVVSILEASFAAGSFSLPLYTLRADQQAQPLTGSLFGFPNALRAPILVRKTLGLTMATIDGATFASRCGLALAGFHCSDAFAKLAAETFGVFFSSAMGPSSNTGEDMILELPRDAEIHAIVGGAAGAIDPARISVDELEVILSTDAGYVGRNMLGGSPSARGHRNDTIVGGAEVWQGTGTGQGLIYGRRLSPIPLPAGHRMVIGAGNWSATFDAGFITAHGAIAVDPTVFAPVLQ